MGSDVSKAFEVSNGIILNEADGGPYATGGTASPVGLNLPESTIYIQNTINGFILWKKYNDNPNSWRIFDTTDIPYNPVGKPNLDPSDTNASLALDRLGNQTFAEATQYYHFSNTVESTTTSDGWVLKAQVTTPVVPTGKYILHFAGNLTNTQKKTTGFQVNWRSDGFTGFNTIFDTYASPVEANVFELRAGFREITISNESTVTIQALFGWTIGGGTARINAVDFYLFKVSDL